MVYLYLSDFVAFSKDHNYKFCQISKYHLAFWLADGSCFTFQIFILPGEHIEYIATNDMELNYVFRSDSKLLLAMQKDIYQLQNKENVDINHDKEFYLSYKGVIYNYAFEFSISLDNNISNSSFNVVTSNYRAKTEDFTGMCLENEYMVISRKKNPSDAYFEIIREIVDCIIDIDNMSKDYPGKKYTPLLKVTDEKFLAKYKECTKSEKSLEYYYELSKKLDTYVEKLGTNQRNITEETIFDIIDFPAMMYFFKYIRSKIPQINFIKGYKLFA